jgi:hypothetical protein
MLSADEFRSKFQSPVLTQLFDYWQGLRGSRPMPAWSEIRPEEIAPVLPHIWAWRIDAEGAPRVRLAGEQIVGILKRNVRGHTPEDLYPPDEAAAIRARIHMVTTEPVGSVSIGSLYRIDVDVDIDVDVGIGERLALPYADGHGGRGVIGASRATMGLDPETGKIIPFNPRALYRLEGTEYLMRID